MKNLILALPLIMLVGIGYMAGANLTEFEKESVRTIRCPVCHTTIIINHKAK